MAAQAEGMCDQIAKEYKINEKTPLMCNMLIKAPERQNKQQPTTIHQNNNNLQYSIHVNIAYQTNAY